jgi:hypothetical protein
MGTVNMNFRVLQSWNKRTGEDPGEYEWRDYGRDNIDGDGRSRYQLWKNERYTWESFDPKSMAADRERMMQKAREDEKRADERAATKGGWGGHKNVHMLLGALSEHAMESKGRTYRRALDGNPKASHADVAGPVP